MSAGSRWTTGICAARDLTWPNSRPGPPTAMAASTWPALSDLTAFALVFPNEDPPKVLVYFWLPEDTVRERSLNQMVPYDVWVRQELIEATPGDITDYDVVRERIKELADEFSIKEILAGDPYNAWQLTTQLETDGLLE